MTKNKNLEKSVKEQLAYCNKKIDEANDYLNDTIRYRDRPFSVNNYGNLLEMRESCETILRLLKEEL